MLSGVDKTLLDVYLAEDILQGEDVPFYLLWKGAEVQAIDLQFTGFSSLVRLFNVDERVRLPQGGRVTRDVLKSEGYLGGILATQMSQDPYLEASLKVRVWLSGGVSKDFAMDRTLYSVRVKDLSVPHVVQIPLSDPKSVVDLELAGAATVLIDLQPLEETSVKLGLPREVLTAMEKFASAVIEGITSLKEEFPQHSDVIASLLEIKPDTSMRQFFDSLIVKLEAAKQDRSFVEALALVFIGALIGQANVRDSVLLPLMEYFEANVSTKAYLKSPFLSAWVPAGGGTFACKLTLEDLRSVPCGDPVVIRTRIESKTEQVVPIKDIVKIRRG